MNNDIISRKALKKTMWDESHSIATFTECGTEEARLGLTIDEVGHIIDEAPTPWHPFTEEPNEEGQYLVQHFYRDWNGNKHITFDTNCLEDLVSNIERNKKYGNRDSHYQAWQKIEPYEEEEK